MGREHRGRVLALGGVGITVTRFPVDGKMGVSVRVLIESGQGEKWFALLAWASSGQYVVGVEHRSWAQLSAEIDAHYDRNKTEQLRLDRIQNAIPAWGYAASWLPELYSRYSGLTSLCA